MNVYNFDKKQAHILVKKALECEEFGLIEEAIEFHSQAANYFNLAILQTTNDQTINALKILSQNHASKANDLRQYHELTILNKLQNNSKNNNSYQSYNHFNNYNHSISTSTTASSSSIINYASPVTPTTESALLNNNDFYPNLNSTPPTPPTSHNHYNESYSNSSNTNNSSPLSNWFGIEKLMDILPKPQIIFQRNKNNKDNNNNSNKNNNNNSGGGNKLGIVDGSLLNSFYMVESERERESERDSFDHFSSNNNNNNNQGMLGRSDGSTCSNSSSSYIDQNLNCSTSSSMMEVEKLDNQIKLQQELNLVNQTVKVLIDENERTARYLRNITQENIYLKRCIIQFRQEMNRELEKKTSNLKYSDNNFNNHNSTTTTNYNDDNNNNDSEV
ncbi:hypothetical protein PPL_05511 [Heterostelium album PN500]|uniref:MIT domain-containing protein n=1 Tax=Heterostelium pallidum (strain ATCC 26659 / Pp 5 / PN500) TaxID=670386 RepID=D3BAD5_HETP5|nr:hypothetical protein PPL_05511 [Heterostelium album PN500]EFA81522.1 hypothetical protein PPL_05511 [Heterostelium album PN500]|eukprot:XP_020433639.1 hypothetical protein PPL_05511 [Heterostelium album PN500]